MAFQRAQAMEYIARALPATDQRVTVLRRLSALHAARGLELMRADQSAMHWLPAFAMLYFVSQTQGSS
jgi:hypothetical protein